MKHLVRNIILFIPLAILFVTLATLLLGGTGLLRNVTYIADSGDNLYTKTREAETVQDVDVLFIGSSHSYRTFDPRIFARHGVKAFNLGSSNQTPLQSEVLLRTLLPKVNPRLVVFEVHPDIIAYDGIEAAIYQLCNVKPSLPMALMALRSRNWRVVMTALYAIPRNLLSSEFNHRSENTVGYAAGFLEHELEYYSPQPLDTVAIQPLPRQLDALRRCTSWIQACGIPYILLEVPDTKNLLESYSNLPEFQSLMGGYGKFCFKPLDSLDDSLHFYNQDHLNQHGVELYDEYICDSLILPLLNSL